MNLLNMSFSATVLILVIILIRALLLHKLPKRTFLALWYVTLFRLLVPFKISSPFSIYTIINILKGSVSESESGFVGIPVIENHTEITQTFTPLPKESVTTLSTFMVIWFIGFLVCILFFLVTHLRCRREYKTALPIDNNFIRVWQQVHPLKRRIQIRQSDRITTPLTYGIFYPIILLPKQTDGTDETRLHYILTHEFVHIKRFDTLTKLLMATALSVHWFNPFVWLMFVLLNRDIELSCDEAVVRHFGQNMKSAYALTLIGLEEERVFYFSPLINNFNKNAIEKRIVSIMKAKRTSLIGILIAFVIVVGTVIVFATNATNIGPANKPTTYTSNSTENSDKDFTAYADYGLSYDIQTEAISGDEITDSAIDTTVFTQDGNVPVTASSEGMMTPDELAKLYSVYEPFGVTYDKEKDCFYYEGKLVQTFIDILSSNGEPLESGNFSGSLRQHGFHDKGEVNIKAVRDYTKSNKDGEGKLVGIEVVE